MANFLMIMLHIMAVIFGLVGLFVTIPLHLILISLNKETKGEISKE